MKIKDIALGAAYVGQRVVKAICVGAQEVWSAIKYIIFKDPVVEQICATNWGDGTGLTEEDAAKVTDIGTVFRNNTEITSFEEISKFGVTTLSNSNGAFLGCTNLRSIDLKNMEVIADNSFQNCTSLSSPVIAPNLKTLGEYMTFANSKIEEVLDIGHVTTIGTYTFRGCTKLRKVVLPESCKTLKSEAFANLPLLQEINLSHIESLGNNSLSGLPMLTQPLVNEHITVLAGCGNSGFTECNCPNVENIAAHTFYACSNLSGSLDFPKLKTIGELAFFGTKITSIINLGYVTEIGNRAFEGCKQITSAVLPNTITKLGINAFNGCSNMMIEDVNLPNLTSLGDSAFRYCDIRKISSLGSASIITTFEDNKNLKSINLHEGVTQLGWGTFRNCKSLGPTIDLPSTLSDIGYETFSGCISLKTIISKAVTPPTCTSLGITSSTESIYVPDQSVSAYREASGWSAYADRIKPLSQYVEPTNE
jgi:hypothetical protein